MKILYADLSEHVAKKLEMPDDVKYDVQFVMLKDNCLHMHNGDVLYVGENQFRDR